MAAIVTPSGLVILQDFTNKFNQKGTIWGSIVIAAYVSYNDPKRYKKAIIISENPPNQSGQKISLKESDNGILHFLIRSEAHWNYQIDYFQTPEKPTKAIITNLIGLNIYRIGWNSENPNTFEIDPKIEHSIHNREMQLVPNYFFPNQTYFLASDLIYFEKTYHLILKNRDDDAWEQVGKYLMNFGFEDKLHTWGMLIAWNNKVKLQNSISIPLLLLTTPPSTKKQRLQLKDLRMVSKQNHPKYLWRIFWNDLNATEKRNSFHCFEQNQLEETISISRDEIDKKLNINDFFVNETLFHEMKLEDIKLPDSCYEVSMHFKDDDPLNIEEHFQDQPNDGIVVLRIKSQNILEAACTTKAALKHMTSLFYQCSFQEEQYNDPERYALLDEVYVKVDIFQFPFYISQKNLDSIFNNTSNKYFIINDTPLKIKFSIDKKAADLHTGAQMSGFHCQEGTDLQISIVYPINATSIQEAKEKINKRTKRS